MTNIDVRIDPPPAAPNLTLGAHAIHAIPPNQIRWGSGSPLPAHLQHPAARQSRRAPSFSKRSRRKFNSADHAFSSGEQVVLYQQQQYISGDGDWGPSVNGNGMSEGDLNLIVHGREPSEPRTGSHLHTRSG